MANPCVKELRDWYPEAVEIQEGSLIEDFSALVGARHLVLSRSTFSWMGMVLNPKLQTLYSPDLKPARFASAPFDFLEFQFPGYPRQLEIEVRTENWNLHPEIGAEEFEKLFTTTMLGYSPLAVTCEVISNPSGLGVSELCPEFRLEEG
eukprot:CAMPEP_0184301956 /NCGR_PEP_ID=MMETSP1049-20130417/12053_1 /TAXON_ID=77928 /ORGANISM="Proteomonas sulcata, Strain CCMP704" /LENGTH=148 /DNA_ID=CAMNT_0026613109 /DNA_START=202 /DNA_END=645 /DNA_ORIENTATION=+